MEENSNIIARRLEVIFAGGGPDQWKEGCAALESQLGACAPAWAIHQLTAKYNENADIAAAYAQKAGMYTEQKKALDIQNTHIADMLIRLLKGYGISKFGDETASVTTRKTQVLEVTDEQQLIEGYLKGGEYDALKKALPSWVSIKLSVNKTELKKYCQNDDTLLRTKPEIIHTKENTTIQIKPTKTE